MLAFGQKTSAEREGVSCLVQVVEKPVGVIVQLDELLSGHLELNELSRELPP